MKPIDITGEKFKQLIAIKLHHIDNIVHGTRHYWTYRCICGKNVVKDKNSVSIGNVESCGCYRKIKPHQVKHRMSNTKFYKTWTRINTRCYNINNSNYKYYGGKGISVRWNNFNEFHNDMYKKYIVHLKKHGKRNTTIDRIDSSKDYCKDNCRWATWKVQNRH